MSGLRSLTKTESRLRHWPTDVAAFEAYWRAQVVSHVVDRQWQSRVR